LNYRGLKMNKNLKWLIFTTLIYNFFFNSVQAGNNNHQYRYQYIPLTDVQADIGEGIFFSQSVIDDRGRVWGKYWTSADGITRNAVYSKGKIKVYQSSITYITAVNIRGTLGGCVEDPETGSLQAALVRSDEVELIPFLPGETRTCILSSYSLNDSDAALVWSEDPSGLNENTYRVFKKGKNIFSYKLPTGSDDPIWGLNNQGTVAGNIADPNLDFRAIRFERPYGEPEFLKLYGSGTDSSTSGINNRGHILGKTGDYIGIWNKKGDFSPYLINGSSLCCSLLFNDDNLIVTTFNYEAYNAGNFDILKSYLSPKPGVLIDIEKLVVNKSDIKTKLFNILDINNNGDMIGIGLPNSFGSDPAFLLKRLPNKDY
jgi:hypothetical protein